MQRLLVMLGQARTSDPQAGNTPLVILVDHVDLRANPRLAALFAKTMLCASRSNTHLWITLVDDGGLPPTAPVALHILWAHASFIAVCRAGPPLATAVVANGLQHHAWAVRATRLQPGELFVTGRCSESSSTQTVDSRKARRCNHTSS